MPLLWHCIPNKCILSCYLLTSIPECLLSKPTLPSKRVFQLQSLISSREIGPDAMCGRSLLGDLSQRDLHAEFFELFLPSFSHAGCFSTLTPRHGLSRGGTRQSMGECFITSYKMFGSAVMTQAFETQVAQYERCRLIDRNHCRGERSEENFKLP